jgi:hypothetical protein
MYNSFAGVLLARVAPRVFLLRVARLFGAHRYEDAKVPFCGGGKNHDSKTPAGQARGRA